MSDAIRAALRLAYASGGTVDQYGMPTGGAVRPHFADGGSTGDDTGYGGGQSMYGGYDSGSSSGYGGGQSTYGGYGNGTGGSSYGSSSSSSYGGGQSTYGGYGNTGVGGSYSSRSSSADGYGGGSSMYGGYGNSTVSNASSGYNGGQSTYGGYGNGTGGSSYGGGNTSGLGSIGSGSATSIGSGSLGSGFGSFGGSTYGGDTGNGWSNSSSLIGSGLSPSSQTMIGRAMSDLSALGGYGGGVGSVGGSTFGSSPAGYTGFGAFSPGSIGLSGLSTVDGMSGRFDNPAKALGFGNFGNTGLGDNDGLFGGLNPTGLGIHGLADGSVPFTASSLGFRGYDGYSAPSGTMALGYGLGQSLAGDVIGQHSFSPFGGLNGNESANLGLPNNSGVGTPSSPGVLSAAPVSPVMSQGLGAATPGATAPAGSAISADDTGGYTPGGLIGLRNYAQAKADNPDGFGTFGALDRGVNFQQGQDQSIFGPGVADRGIPHFTGADDVGTVGAPQSVARVGTATDPGFDNFGLSGIGTQVGSFAGGDYTPQGWTPVSEKTDMIANPGDYFGPQGSFYADKYPGLTIHPTAAGIAALIGNASVESGGIRSGLGNIAPDAVNSIGATGMFQHLGDRKTGLLNALGIDPNSSREDIQRGLDGTYADQLAYGLNEIATDPAYAATRKAITSPGVSVADATQTFMHNFERPGETDERRSIAARLAAANAAMGFMADAHQYAANNLGIPGVGGYVAPATQAAFSPSAEVERPSVTVDPMAGFSPGAASGADGLMSLGGWTSGAYSGDDSTPADQLRTGWDAETGGSEPGVYQQGLADSAKLAASILGGRVASANAPADSDPANLTVGVPTSDGVTPQYLPGQKTALKTAANVAAGLVPGVGIANMISGLLGGPTAGSLLTDYSQPGTANLIDGGKSGDGRSSYYGQGGYSGYGAGSGQGAIPQVITPAHSATSIAQQAYLEALKHLPGPGAKAVKANALDLVAPDASMTAGFYNPMLDPAVQAALR